MQKCLSAAVILSVISSITACSNAGGGAVSSPNSITGVATSLNDDSYTAGDAPIFSMTSGSGVSGVSLVNGDGSVWQTSYLIGENFTWSELSALPGVGAESRATTTAINSFGYLFASSVAGGVYLYNDSSWGDALGGITESSEPTSMVIASGNNIYLGNESGNLWYFNEGNQTWSDNLSNGGFTPSGAITQVILDAPSPTYMGVATGAYLWACQLSNGSTCGAWENIVQTAIDQAIYSDAGSFINTIGFYQDAVNAIDYGYLGNAAGHVWRAIYQTSTGSLLSFADMSNDPNFPGYSGNGEVTSLVVDSDNTLYVGTATGQVEIWTTGTAAWSNITPSDSSTSCAITSLTVYNSNTVLVGNECGSMWSITWN